MNIKLGDKEFAPFISKQEIAKAVERLALEISKDYRGTTPVFLCLLKGSFLFAADLLRAYPGKCEIEFIQLSSYRGTHSSGHIELLQDLKANLDGREIVVIEDIVDTGNTLKFMEDFFDAHGWSHWKIATLFYKPGAYLGERHIDYVGMEIPDAFIVGYGLDYNELGRNLPQIYKIVE
jgi:adenylate kinase